MKKIQCQVSPFSLLSSLPVSLSPPLPSPPLLHGLWTEHWGNVGWVHWLTQVSGPAWRTPADRCRPAASAGPLPWPAGSLRMSSRWWEPPELWAAKRRRQIDTDANKRSKVGAHKKSEIPKNLHDAQSISQSNGWPNCSSSPEDFSLFLIEEDDKR